MLFLASKWEINSFYFDKYDRTASVLTIGNQYLAKAGLAVAIDIVAVILFVVHLTIGRHTV